MKKIVIIEDDTTLRENTIEFLLEEGYKAYAASDGAAGVQLVLETMPDLILCDINMPVMDGYEVLKTLQGISSTLSIPFIFMTAKTQKEEVRHGMQLGVDDYITKPFSFDELLTVVKVRLEKHKKVLNNYENKYLSLVEIADKQMEKSNLEILKLDKVKLDFLKMISQELRNPIERIKEPIKLLKYKVDNKNMAALIEIIDESIIQLDKFSLQALEITKLKTDYQINNNSKAMVASLFEFALLTIQKNHDNKKINISMKIQDKLSVSGDTTLLVKCFANILDNACKFSKNNGVVEITATAEKNNIVIKITDHGVGFTGETLENINTMLLSKDKSSEFGSGLGLFHSKLLLDAHSGSIKIQSVENQETTVIITLPNK